MNNDPKSFDHGALTLELFELALKKAPNRQIAYTALVRARKMLDVMSYGDLGESNSTLS